MILLAVALVLAVLSASTAQAVAANRADALRFAVLGDPHVHSEPTTGDGKPIPEITIQDWMNNPNFPDLDFVVIVGDMTHYGDAEGWRRAMVEHNFNGILIPWIFVFGNHDTADYFYEPDTPYNAILRGENEAGLINPHYAFCYDNILFLVLGDEGVTHLCPRNQKNWLELITSLYPDKTTVIFSHNTVYDTTGGSTSFDYRYFGDLEWWKDFLTSNPQIVLFIHGHNHLETNNHASKYGVDFLLAPCVNHGTSGYFAQYNGDQSLYVEIRKDGIVAKKWSATTDSWIENYQLTNGSSPTTFAPMGWQWYSTTWRVQDGQSFSVKNRIVAQNYKLQLIGEDDPELVLQNEDFDYCGGGGGATYHWWGYDDSSAREHGTTAGWIEFHGVDELSASTTFNAAYSEWIGGKVPYSTAPRVVPGKEYRLRVRLRADAPVENAMDVSVMVLGENLSHVVMEKTPVLRDLDLTPEWQWFEGTFTVPENDEAWIVKTIWNSKQPGVTCYMDRWSITRADSTGTTTENFEVNLNGEKCFYPGALNRGEYYEHYLNPTTINNELNFSVSIGGSRVGFVRLVYENPLLWSDDVSFGVNSVSGDIYNCYNCHLEMVANYSPDQVTLYPLRDWVDVEGSSDVSVKGYYTVKVMENSKIPGDYNVRCLRR